MSQATNAIIISINITTSNFANHWYPRFEVATIHNEKFKATASNLTIGKPVLSFNYGKANVAFVDSEV